MEKHSTGLDDSGLDGLAGLTVTIHEPMKNMRAERFSMRITDIEDMTDDTRQ